jgi:hypothetical protein
MSPLAYRRDSSRQTQTKGGADPGAR